MITQHTFDCSGSVATTSVDTGTKMMDALLYGTKLVVQPAGLRFVCPDCHETIGTARSKAQAQQMLALHIGDIDGRCWFRTFVTNDARDDD